MNNEELVKLLQMTPSLESLSVAGSCGDMQLLNTVFFNSNISRLDLLELGHLACSVQRISAIKVSCKDACFPRQFAHVKSGELNLCLCKMRMMAPVSSTISDIVDERNANFSGSGLDLASDGSSPNAANERFGSSSTVNATFSFNFNATSTTFDMSSNATNMTNSTFDMTPTLEPKHRYYDSLRYSIILGSVSVLALLLNFIILAKMCHCQGQSVSKIFGMSMLLFNVLLAEYGIALAIYLTQEDGTWSKSYCQAITAVKIFAMSSVIFALLCLTFQWSINPPDDNYNTQDVRFKAIIYILEGVLLSGMICVLAWTKFDDWGYLCHIDVAKKSTDQIILGVEYCFHSFLFLLALRLPYKRIRRKQPTQSYIKMKEVVESEHPVFIMTLSTFLIWSVPFFVTIPKFGLTNSYLTPLVRNFALVFGAVVLPLLFVIRNTRMCCSRHTACGVNDPGVCQCTGRSSDMCYACDLQHKDMISNCEFHSFADRRKSLSLDDLKYVLGIYKKEAARNLKLKKRKLVSRSFPIINMDTIEEADVEDIGEIERFLLQKDRHFELSIETTKTPSAALRRQSTTSLPLLMSPRKVPASGKSRLRTKLSLSPHKSAMLSPVKKALQKKRAATLDNQLMKRNSQSSTSDRSTTSSPTKSDGEVNSLLKRDKKLLKRAKKNAAKSKESIKSKEKSKESLKNISKNQLDVETPNADSPEPASPNRVSRIPSFIPLADAESTGSLGKQKSPQKVPAKGSPAKQKLAKKKPPLLKSSKGNEDEEMALLGEDPDRVPSRGPTFFLVGDKETDSDNADKPLIGKEKKAKRGMKKHRRKDAGSKEGTPLHEVDGVMGSRFSLEWDPSYSLSDSSCSSPIDEFNPPEPAPPPSNFALEKVREMGVRNPDSPHISIGRGSSYSMDWDPTGIQERHSVTSQCDWEPYSVDEARSTPTSPEDLAIQKVAIIPTANGNNNNSSEANSNSNVDDQSLYSKTAPIATADV